MTPVVHLGMEVMHERNAHNFPLDLVSNDDDWFNVANNEWDEKLDAIGPGIGEPYEF